MTLTFNVDLGRTYQKMDGFGICEGYGRARIIAGSEGLPTERTREVLELLFSESGAAFPILRLCIGCSTSDGPGTMKSIAPVGPSKPDRPLRYEWSGDDCGQVWLARTATMEYGVRRIFANALSAPAYMMHIQPDTRGGLVQGMPGTPAEAGDWRPAFAQYLLRYVQLYAESGVTITDLSFANQPDLLIHEPDRAVKYPLLRLEPHHLVDFVKVLGAAIDQSGMAVRIVCGNAMSWNQQAIYTAAVEADVVAARYVGVHAANNYATRARNPLPTTRPTWMGEWDPGGDDQTWNDAWDSGDPSDGILLAEDVSDALTMADVSGYLYWLGASARAGTRALIWLDGPDYRVSKRFWALAAYSRFIRPGAHRVCVRPDPIGGPVKVAAFKGPDGDVVVNLLNLGADATDVRVVITPGSGTAVARRWLTDADHALTLTNPGSPVDRVALPARSLTTMVFHKPGT
jgi:glucuronoarabinoxylan endo-1,4-beta-xylanase